MKKKVLKILISAIVLGIFVLPFSFNVNKNELGIQKNFVKAESMQIEEVGTTDVSTALIVTLMETGTEITYKSLNMKVSIFEGSEEKALETRNYQFKASTSRQDIRVTFSGLKPSTSYRVDATIEHTQGEPLKGGTGFGTKSAGSTGEEKTDEQKLQEGMDTARSRAEEIDIGCSWNPKTWVTNCIVAGFYHIIFVPIAAITELSAKVLDYFVYYSINSSSYKAAFVEKGWSAVRDVCNIFFIITLLYIAIKTILGLNTTNNKKYIAYVIIFSLLINFSLFTTKVVIDSSNILAKIFYFQIEPKDSNGIAVEPGGQRSITVSLVKAMNPKKIIEIPSDNLGKFTLVIFLSTGVCVFMIWVFLSVALLFVSRVVSLWISMIFSPVAFVSYALPFKIKQIGNEDWWSELFSNAFLAPIFIFFLYIILMFGNALPAVQTDITDANGAVDTMAKILIPFALMIVLLLKARDLAKEYAGKMGEMLIKGAKAVGGVVAGAALAVATGGISAAVGGASAGMLTGGVGRSLAGAATKQGLGGFMARQGLKTLNYGAKASFDPRSGVVGKGFSNLTGINLDSALLKKVGLGTDKTAGGFNARRDRKVKKIMDEAELYKTKMTDPEVKAWSAKRIAEYEAKDDEYKSKHERPKEYKNAAQLNKDRLEEFRKRLGTSDLLGSLSHTILSKAGQKVTEENYKDSEEYKKDNTLTADEINNKRAKKLKMKLGVGAILSTGGLAGGYAMMGAGAFGGAQSVLDSAAEKEASKKLVKQREASQKELDKLQDIDTKREDRKKYMDFFEQNNKDLMEKAKEAKMTMDQYIETQMDQLKKEEELIKQKRDINNERRRVTDKELDDIGLERRSLEARRTAALGLKKDRREEELQRIDNELDLFNRREAAVAAKRQALEAEKNTIAAEFTKNLQESQKISSASKGRDRVLQFEKELRALNDQEAASKKKLEELYAAPARKSDHKDDHKDDHNDHKKHDHNDHKSHPTPTFTKAGGGDHGTQHHS